MNNKGFTLIELLAVIVILAGLVLITIPIMNDILSSSKKETKEVSVRNYIKAVEQSLYLYEMDEDTLPNGTYKITTNGKICINSGCTNLLNVDIDGEKPSSGSIEIINNKVVNISNLKYTKYSATFKNEKIIITGLKKICILTDTDGDKKADTGEVITCGSEKFYTVDSDTTTVTMLAEKNITLPSLNANGEVSGYPKQSDDVKTMPFGGGSWQEFSPYGFATGYPLDGKDFVYDSNSDIYIYVEAYENYLISIGVSSAAATLISTSQLEKLGCSTTSCSSNYEWVYSISYWTGSALIDYDTSIYYVNSSGYLSGYSGSAYEYISIRPLVTISVDELG